MADKEERIYVGIIDQKGDFCPVPYGTCNSLCDNCKGGMTRQEAIEKMAKGIHRYKKQGGLFVDGYAEAALNALLEGVKKWK